MNKRIVGLVVILIMLVSFLIGLLSMLLSEKDREYFGNRVINSKSIQFHGGSKK